MGHSLFHWPTVPAWTMCPDSCQDLDHVSPCPLVSYECKYPRLLLYKDSNGLVWFTVVEA